MSTAATPSVLLGPPEKGEPPLATSDAFHKRHRSLRFTMDFNRAKEAVVDDPTLDLKWRVLEEISLGCWSNYRDYYSDAKGRPLLKSDIAKKLNVEKQRVSEAVAELVENGYLRIVGRIIFLIDDPKLELKGEESENCPDGSDNGSPNFRQKPSREELRRAEAYWSKHAPDRFEVYQKVGEKVTERERAFKQSLDERKALREEMLTAFWKHQEENSQPEEPAGCPTRPDNQTTADSPTRPDKTDQDSPTRPDNSSDPSGEEPDVSLYVFKSLKKLASYVEKVVSECEAVERSSLEVIPGDRHLAIQLAAKKLLNEVEENRPEILRHFAEDLRQIALRRENKPRGWGILDAVMNAAILAEERERVKSSRRAHNARPAEYTPTTAEQITSLEELLEATPTHPQAASWREQIEALKRKPAGSEGRTKAREVGQR